MKRKYKRLNYADRKAIEKMCKNGDTPKVIAEAAGVHLATVYHELQRGGAGSRNREKYSAEQAQRAV